MHTLLIDADMVHYSSKACQSMGVGELNEGQEPKSSIGTILGLFRRLSAWQGLSLAPPASHLPWAH